ncbi:TIGR04222 domain-containing membrane protein [Streptomyces spiramenti]|uniref:TIGR04222 domain-containing membrane protein n=1 Tax=Streptomyces spiramenti TaxID=2720606 RepID=A0ABX1AW21_9ACTN|nr:TIGR04222 domain-containing membrane protein [Streptomyces spiramenti]NJP69225.1 TIGR04222 domain-containing membrane protein [Streptomyces spiramenti]
MVVIWWGFAVVAVVLATAVLDRVRSGRWGAEPRDAAVRDVYETAALAGGPRALVDAAICSLHDKQRLRVEGSRVVLVQPVADDPVERAVIDCFGAEWKRRLNHVRSEAASRRAVRDVRRELDERGLLYSAAYARSARTRVVLRLAACGLVTVGSVVALAITSPGTPTLPVGLLIAAAVVTQVIVVVLPAPRNGAPTTAGVAALARARREHVPQRSGSAREFAVGGAAVLAGTALGAALLLPMHGTNEWPPERYADAGPGNSGGGGVGCGSTSSGCGGDGGGSGCGGGCGS